MLVVVVTVVVLHQHVELRRPVAIQDVARVHHADVTRDVLPQVVVVHPLASPVAAHQLAVAKRAVAAFWLDSSAARRAAVLQVANLHVVVTLVALLPLVVVTPVARLHLAATLDRLVDVTPDVQHLAVTQDRPAVVMLDVHRLAAIVLAEAF